MEEKYDKFQGSDWTGESVLSLDHLGPGYKVLTFIVLLQIKLL